MDDKPNHSNKLLQYSGLGFQMMAFIGIFIAIGYFVDKKIQAEKPWGILICSLVGSILSIIYMIRAFDKIK